MIRKSLYFGLIIFLLIVFSAGAAPKAEFRGAWVTAWQNGFLTPAEADETVRMAKLANINALLVQVRKTGDALYKSSYEPRARLSDPDYDPLAYIIEKAHAEGIEVHAWLNTFRVTTRNGTSDPAHICNLHPDWVNVKHDGTKMGSEGLYLDPGIPEVQDWTYNLFMDIVRNYDVDGVHFDYIRYPGRDFGYSEKALSRFNKETGRTGKPDPKDAEWSKWRRNQVTALVRRVYKGVKAVKPRVRVTASVITRSKCPEDFASTEAFIYLHQNWAAWADEGIVDGLIPMNYQHADRFAVWVDGMKRWCTNRPTFTGIGATISAGSVPKPDQVVSEIKVARQKGLPGVCIFAFNGMPWREALAKTLREQVFQEPAETPFQK